MRHFAHRLVIACSFAGILSTGSACIVSPRTAHDLATAAIWTAAIASHVAILAHHDAHFHYDHCGHYRRWHDERWVYYYGDHWEYYDSHAGVWYRYGD